MKKEILTLNIKHADFIYHELQASLIEQHVLHRFKYTQEELCALLFSGSPIANGLILLIDDVPSGFLIYTIDHQNFSLNPSPNFYLNDLYIQKPMRRLGGATLLLNALQKIAKEKGCGQIEWLVQKDNQAAQGFYKNFNLTRLCHDLEYVRLKLS